MKKAICIMGAGLCSLVIIFATMGFINEESLKNTQPVVQEKEQTSRIYEILVNREETESAECVEYVDATATASSFNENIQAKSAILIDVNTKSILYEKDADEKMAPASTTKLMTAITAYECLKLKEKITVGEEISLIKEGSSVAGLKQGQVLSFEELLEALLISSGNDAAYTIAAAAGREIIDSDIANDNKEFTTEDYIAEFVLYMNKNVKKLGLTDTVFKSPDGYDETGQYTTAKDLSKIAMAVLDNEDICRICNMTSVRLKEQGLSFETTNQLLKEDSEYYYQYAKGLKTGSTDDAGKCLVSYGVNADKVCISVVLGSSDDGRWEDSKALLKLGLE